MKRTWMWAAAATVAIGITGCETSTAHAAGTAMVPIQNTANPAKQEAVSSAVSKSLAFLGDPGVTSTSAVSVALPAFVDANVGYAAMNGQILQTRDGGATWGQVGTVNGDVQALAFANASTGVALARTVVPIGSPVDQRDRVTDAIYRTTDGGREWTRVWSESRVETGQTMTTSGDRIAMFGSRGYAVAGGSLFTTSDGGAAWRQIAVPGRVLDMSAPLVNDLWLSISTAPVAADGSVQKGAIELLHSVDGGAHLHVAIRTAPLDVWEAAVQFGSTSDGLLLVKDLDSWMTTAYWTTNGGATWHHEQANAYEGRILQAHPAFLGTAGDLAFVALEPGAAPFPGGITTFNLRSGSVSQVAQQPDWREVNLAAGPEGSLFAAVSLSQGGMGLYRSADGGKSWRMVYPQGQPNVAVRFVTPKDGIGVGSDDFAGYIYTTTDGGRTWHTVRAMNGEFPTAIAYANATTVYVTAVVQAETGATQLHMLVSHDAGKTWTDLGACQLPASAAKQLTESNVQMALSVADGHFAMVLATAYPSVSLTSTNGVDWTQMGSFNSPLGIATAAYDSPSALWISSVTQVRQPTKTEPGVYQTTLERVAGSHVERRVSLPQGYAALGMNWTGDDGWVLAAKSPFDVQQGLAMFVTHDGGRTWSDWQTVAGAASLPQPLNLYPSGTVFNLSLVNTTDGYLLTANGLLATTDGGHTWRYVD